MSGSTPVVVNPPPKLSLSPNPGVLFVGMTRTIAALYDTGSVRHSYIAIHPLSWSSDNIGVARVDSLGVVTTVAPGRAIISATYPIQGRVVTIEDSLDVLAPPAFRFSTASGGPFPEDLAGLGTTRLDRSCALNATDGGIYCWDLLVPTVASYDGCELGYPQGHYLYKQCSEIPIRLPASVTFTTLSSGRNGGCALATTNDVYCFGLNLFGELGVAPTEPIFPFAWTDHGLIKVSLADQFRSVHAMGTQRCAIRVDGAAFCWGSGVGTTPTQISGVVWSTLAPLSSGNLNCGLAVDSTAYCWNSQPIAPSQVNTARWTSIDVNSQSVCALAASGRVSCWTYTGGTQAPALVAGDPPLVSIAPMQFLGRFDWSQTCGFSAAGDIYCVRPAGTAPNYTYSLQPLDVGVKLKQFAGTCGLGVDGKAYCWPWRTLQAKVILGQ